MTIVDCGPGQGTSADEFRRHMWAVSGGDRVVSGLQVTFFAGRTIRLAAGQGVVDGVGFSVPSALDFTSTANSQGNPRIDRLVVRLYRTLVPKVGGGEVMAYKCEVVIKEGAPSSPPGLPSLQNDHDGVWEFGLGYWVVPPGGNGNIDNGKVWSSYADDGAQFAGDRDVTIATGTNALVLNVRNDGLFDPKQFAVPGAAKVAMDVVLYCLAAAPCGGVVTLQMAGASRTATYKAMAAGPFTVPVPRFEALIDRNGGPVPAAIEMSCEGAFGAATPVKVGRAEVHMFQVMS